MAYDHSNIRPEKDVVRETVTAKGKLAPRKVALFITVPGVPDVKSALKSGLINKNTKIIAVNHCKVGDYNPSYSPKVANGIKRSLRGLGLTHILVAKHFESADAVEAIEFAVKKWGKIDFAFIDLCGMVSPSVCHALNRMQNSFSSKARLAVTALMELRQRKSIKKYRELFGGFDARASQIFHTPESATWMSLMFAHHWNVPAGKVYVTEKTKAALRTQNNITNLVWQWQATTAALDKWNFRVNHAIKYGDCLSMGLIIFDLNGAKPAGEYETIREACESKAVGRTTKKGFSPAKQAWITRYQNWLGGKSDSDGVGNWTHKDVIQVKLNKLLKERDAVAV